VRAYLCVRARVLYNSTRPPVLYSVNDGLSSIQAISNFKSLIASTKDNDLDIEVLLRHWLVVNVINVSLSASYTATGLMEKWL